MELRQAQRKQAKIKLTLQGVSGSGKTMSALLLASGITDCQIYMHCHHPKMYKVGFTCRTIKKLVHTQNYMQAV